MTALTTNEWIEIKPGVHPWEDREVLVRMSNGRLTTMEWNGYYWRDPITHIRQKYNEDGLHPTHFYIYEKFNEEKLL